MSGPHLGLLAGLTIIPAIMKEQGCDWAEAAALWRISQEVEAEEAPPTNVIPFPMDRVR